MLRSVYLMISSTPSQKKTLLYRNVFLIEMYFLKKCTFCLVRSSIRSAAGAFKQSREPSPDLSWHIQSGLYAQKYILEIVNQIFSLQSKKIHANNLIGDRQNLDNIATAKLNQIEKLLDMPNIYPGRSLSHLVDRQSFIPAYSLKLASLLEYFHFSPENYAKTGTG